MKKQSQSQSQSALGVPKELTLKNRGQIKRLWHSFFAERPILVVDPSENFRSSIRVFFSNLEVRSVRTVASIREAREILRHETFSLMLIEWIGIEHADNGLKFCRDVRKMQVYRTTPMLLLASENQKNDVMLASEVGIDRYLLKPFTYEEFVKKITEVINESLDPDPLKHLLLQADAYIASGQSVEAERCLRAVLAKNHQSARALSGLAKLCMARGEDTQAITYLKQSTVHNFEYLEAHRLLLSIYERMGDFGGQLKTAQDLNELSPDNPRYHLVLARLYLHQEDLDRSEFHFKRCVLTSPTIAEAYKGLGDVAMLREDFTKAERSYRKALDLDREDISTLNALGLAYVRLGKFDEGLAKYTMALRFQPDDHRILFNMGQAEEKRQHYESASKYYQRALRVHAGYERALRGLDRISERLRELGSVNEEPLGA